MPVCRLGVVEGELLLGRSESIKSFSPQQIQVSGTATVTALDGVTQIPRPEFNLAYPSTGADAVVPAGQYFVLGDNRPNSRDSHLGWFVPAENLVGRAWLSYWPPAAWGVMPGVAYADR